MPTASVLYERRPPSSYMYAPSPAQYGLRSGRYRTDRTGTVTTGTGTGTGTGAGTTHHPTGTPVPVHWSRSTLATPARYRDWHQDRWTPVPVVMVVVVVVRSAPAPVPVPVPVPVTVSVSFQYCGFLVL